MTLTTKVLTGIVLALLLATGVLGWQLRSAHRATAMAAVAPAKEAAAIAKHEDQAATATLAARIDTVKRWLHDTVTVPATTLHPTTPADTAAAVAALPVVEQRYESCRVQLTALLSDCEARSLTADRRARADSVVIAKLDGVIAAGLPMRRWSLGVTAGYGATITAGHVYTGPSATVGLSWRLF